MAKTQTKPPVTVQKTVSTKKTLVNIITRTSNRPVYFKANRDSINEQTYTNIKHIVGCDDEKSFSYIDIPFIKYEKGKVTQETPYPWNSYMNILTKEVTKGYLMYLDDDDKFVSDNALASIMEEVDNEDYLYLWKVKINTSEGRTMIVPSNANFGKLIVPGDINGTGFMVHSKYIEDIKWPSRRFGDFTVIKELSKKLKIKWLDGVYTQAQLVPGNGEAKDKPVVQEHLSQKATNIANVIQQQGDKVVSGLPTGMTHAGGIRS